MITETLTLKFENEEQQRRFHERLNTPEPADDGDAAAVQAARDRVTDIVARAVTAERDRCAKLAFDYGGNDAEEIATMILENVPPS